MTLPFAEWLPRQRWYAGRTRELSTVRPVVVTTLRPDLDLVLLDVGYVEGPGERYQVVVAWSDEPLAGLDERAVIGTAGGRFGYDGLYDAGSAADLLRMCAESARRDAVQFSVEPGVVLPTGEPARVSAAEQSNTSVLFGRRAILKVFRRLTPGINPDIELNRVLGRAGNPNVARLLGAFETEWDGQPCPLGMITEFAADSTEGWALATAAAAERADFTGESQQLGAAVAAVHATLAAELGAWSAEFATATALARLAETAAQVPELAPQVAEIERRFAALSTRPLNVQRIHGDLHLGQVLRTAQRWLVIDFEGEPGTPADERRRPDSALRDVAGMLRSYEYAAFQPLVGGGSADGDDLSAALDWAQRQRDAFCVGYASVAGTDPRADADVLIAYELDKAVYEAGYEARYRPDWLPIPLRSIARLLA